MPIDGRALIITPLLDTELQVKAASVDVRLGHESIVLRRSSVERVDPSDLKNWSANLFKTQERVRIARGHEFVLHPGQLILGGTLEYIALPDDLFASIEGRSSWGRLGLIIATASSIAPGFKGTITLELVNDGEVPLALYPGVRLAQLVLHQTQGRAEYEGKYHCPTGPQFTRLQRDEDIGWWEPRRA